METSLIFTVALAAAIIVIVLALVAVIVFQRWRINDSNAHLKEFIDENMELRRNTPGKGCPPLMPSLLDINPLIGGICHRGSITPPKGTSSTLRSDGTLHPKVP